MEKKQILTSLMTAASILLSSCASVVDSSSGYAGVLKNKFKYGNVTKQFQSAVSFANTEWLDEILTAYPEYDINYYADTKGQFGGYDYETLRRVISAFHLNVTYVNRNNMLEYLLSKGLNPNIKFSNGNYALDWLCADFNDRPYLVKTMLNYGADPNNANSAGFYEIDLGEKNKDTLRLPIYWGIYKPAYTNAEDLLASGAAVTYDMLHYKLYNGYETLDYSAKPYQLAFKRYLETTDNSQFSKAEEYAILGENDKLIEELKNGKELDDLAAVVVRDFICRFGTVEALEVWDEVYGERHIREDHNYKYKPGRQLVSAASEGNYEIVKYLIDSGKIKLPFEVCYTVPLENAALAGSYDICKLFLDNDYRIETPVHNISVFKAAFNGQDIEVFRLIAKHLTDKDLLTEVDIYNALETLPIKWSSFTKAAIDCLMDECGMTLQFFPIIDTDFETVEYLFEKGKPLSVVDLPSAIISKDAKAVKLLLDMGADPNQHSYFKNLRLNDRESIEKMMMPYDEFMEWIKHNDITTSESSLHLSVVFGNSEIVSLLIEYGMNIDDDMALYMAIKSSSKATFDVLYNAGASLDYKDDEDKETLLDAAKAMGRDDIVKILKKAGVKSYRG